MRLVLAAVGLVATTALAAAEPDTTPVALRTAVRGVVGVDGRAGFGLGMASIGGDVHLSPSLTLGGQLVGQVPFGSIHGGEPAPFGFGGELTLRAMLLPDATIVRPYLTWNLGIALFPVRPFLPGGDIYDFLIGGGVGAEVSPTPTWRLALELFMLHESNGQGIGPFNPSFDGFGMAVAMSWSDRPIAPLTADDRDPRTGARTSRMPGVSLEGSLGQVADDVLGTGHLGVAYRLGGPLMAIAELEHGVFAGERLTEGGAALVAHVDNVVSAGAYAGYRHYAGLGTIVGTGQVEWHAMSAASLVGLVHFERSDYTGQLWRAGLGMRTYVRDSVMVVVGIGFNDLSSDGTFEDITDPFVGFEWRLPLPIADAGWQLSLYGERRISTLNVAGLRLTWNMGTTPRESARHDAWRRLQ